MAAILAGPASSLPDGPNCGYCGKQSMTLTPCRRCKFIQYCSEKHESSHYQDHRQHCEHLAETTEALSSLCLNLPPGCRGPAAPPCRLEVDLFFTIRQEIINTMQKIKPQDAVMVQKILELVKENIDMERYTLRFCRFPKHYDILPGLLVQLGRDEQAFDTLRWLNVMQSIGDVNSEWWCPFAFMRDANDTCEPEDNEYPSKPGLQHVIGMRLLVLLKIRILLDLKRLAAATQALTRTSLPVEIVDQVRAYMPWSDVVARIPRLLHVEPSGPQWAGLQELIEEKDCEILALGREVTRIDSSSWLMLSDLDGYVDHCNRGPSRWKWNLEQEEIRLSYDAWRQSPGAIELIKGMVDSGDLGEKIQSQGVFHLVLRRPSV